MASQIEEVLNSTRATLAHFIVSLPAPEQVFMVQEAILSFLKDLHAIKAAQSIPKAGDQVRKMTQLSLMERIIGLLLRFLSKRELIFSIKEASILIPSHLTLQVILQVTLKDPPSLSRKERVTKIRKLRLNSLIEFLAISMTQ